MYEPKSTYVRDALHGAPYSERARIEGLLAIERYAASGVRGWIHGMKIEQLWRSENAAFRAILSELNPERLRERAREEESRTRGRRIRGYEQLEAERAEREAWIRAGGVA